MRRVRPDETDEGSTEELARDAAQYAAQAAQYLEGSQQTIALLAGAIERDELPVGSVDSSVNAALVAALAGSTSALLGVSARIGQLCAVLADRPVEPPPVSPEPPPVSPEELRVLRERFPRG